jgi:TonB family protein
MADRHHLVALALSVGLHAAVLFGLGMLPSTPMRIPDVPPETEHIVLIDLSPPPAPTVAVRQPPPPSLPLSPVAALAPDGPSVRSDLAQPAAALTPLPEPDRPRASMEAPPAPSAEEWALASTYTLKNSKRYRHTWAQQVRSMMGTALEGPDQGVVRFRIEIAPNGSLVRLDTLWSTSAKAEQLARQAMQNMPPLPPTPTGEPLVFEKTISFQPFDADVPPIYKDDCIPDPPAYRNPFAWDGKSAQVRAAPVAATAKALDPQALAECLKQLPQDSIEAEAAHNQRQLEQWGSDRLRRTEVPR